MHKHRTWVKISLDNIAHNIAAMRAKMQPDTKLLLSLKANAYGHGAVELARFLQGKCDYFGLACVDEALELRHADITTPLLLLGYTAPEQYAEAIEHDIALTIYTLEQAQQLSRVAAAQEKTATIHLAVDTGMSRLGFADNEKSLGEIAQIAALPNLHIEGIFTHFACADDADKTSALAQFTRFDAFVNYALRITHYAFTHACNSAALIDFDRHYDMIRMGIALYGLYPSDEVDQSALPLLPAMTWKVRVSHVKTVPAGTGISYGHTFVTVRETRVATLPVGYADGYPRALSNTGHVIINGQPAPILGRVCMDQCMVDVTDIPGVAAGDEVVLVGDSISMEQLADWCGTINYEACCRVSARVQRVYTFNGELHHI
ncbi:MAG: alanine racemase [Oscillospiraceae bacterium]|nr:alanine racemase [Oscillospiraceae bacterium]